MYEHIHIVKNQDLKYWHMVSFFFLSRVVCHCFSFEIILITTYLTHSFEEDELKTKKCDWQLHTHTFYLLLKRLSIPLLQPAPANKGVKTPYLGPIGLTLSQVLLSAPVPHWTGDLGPFRTDTSTLSAECLPLPHWGEEKTSQLRPFLLFGTCLRMLYLVHTGRLWVLQTPRSYTAVCLDLPWLGIWRKPESTRKLPRASFLNT